MNNRYSEMRSRQQAAYNDFAKQFIFYAFSNGQFEEGMKKLGLDPEADKEKICFIGSGAYILKDHSADLNDIFRRSRDELQAAIAADQTGDGFIFDMFIAELQDHEFSYTGDPGEAVEACGFSLQEVQENEILRHGLQKAMRYCNDNSPD